MIESLVEDFSKNFNCEFKNVEKDYFSIFFAEDININLFYLDNIMYFQSEITPLLENKKEEIFTYLMKANLLGEGTGKSSIGVDNNEKCLTLSYVMPYENDKQLFKETMEDFINYLLYWRKEIKKYYDLLLEKIH